MIEVEVIRNLIHPNVVKFEKFYEENNQLIIVMEYCDGGDLSKLIKERK